jgi:hypothetical protein
VTPEERAFTARRLRELGGQIRDRIGLLDGHIAERELFLHTAESVAVLVEVLADVVEDQPEADGADGHGPAHAFAHGVGGVSAVHHRRHGGHRPTVSYYCACFGWH